MKQTAKLKQRNNHYELSTNSFRAKSKSKQSKTITNMKLNTSKVNTVNKVNISPKNEIKQDVNEFVSSVRHTFGNEANPIDDKISINSIIKEDKVKQHLPTKSNGGLAYLTNHDNYNAFGKEIICDTKNIHSLNFNYLNNSNIKDERLRLLIDILDLNNILHILEEQSITHFNDLVLLSKDDYSEIGLNISARNRLFRFIEEFKKEAVNYNIEEIIAFSQKNKQFVLNDKPIRNYTKLNNSETIYKSNTNKNKSINISPLSHTLNNNYDDLKEPEIQENPKITEHISQSLQNSIPQLSLTINKKEVDNLNNELDSFLKDMKTVKKQNELRNCKLKSLLNKNRLKPSIDIKLNSEEDDQRNLNSELSKLTNISNIVTSNKVYYNKDKQTIETSTSLTNKCNQSQLKKKEVNKKIEKLYSLWTQKETLNSVLISKNEKMRKNKEVMDRLEAMRDSETLEEIDIDDQSLNQIISSIEKETFFYKKKKLSK